MKDHLNVPLGDNFRYIVVKRMPVICEVIILQLIKINEKKEKNASNRRRFDLLGQLEKSPVYYRCNGRKSNTMGERDRK